MTESELAEAEAKLGVRFPIDYHRLQLDRADELRSYRLIRDGDEYVFFERRIWLDKEDFVSENVWQRDPGCAAEHVVPGWWKEHILIGTNGGGDYYCLRIVGQPSVWFLNHETGDFYEFSESLDRFVEHWLEDFNYYKNHPDDF